MQNKLQTFYLVRHGDYNTLRSYNDLMETYKQHLTDKGKNDISKLASKIQNENLQIKAVVHSPYVRTTETAGILSAAVKSPLQANENLVDSTNIELQTGDYGHMFSRINNVIEGLLQSSQDSKGNFIIVSHQDPLGVYVASKMGNSIEILHQEPSRKNLFKMGTCYKLNFENGVFNEAQHFFDPL